MNGLSKPLRIHRKTRSVESIIIYAYKNLFFPNIVIVMFRVQYQSIHFPIDIRLRGELIMRASPLCTHTHTDCLRCHPYMYTVQYAQQLFTQ